MMKTMNFIEKIMSTWIVGIIIFCMAIPFVIALGYISNIIKLSKLDFEAPYKAEIIRVIGIPFVPMGVVTGYIDIKD